MDEVISEQSRAETAELIGSRIEEVDRRLYEEMIATRRKLELYSLACSWGSLLHLRDSRTMDSPVFDKLFAAGD